MRKLLILLVLIIAGCCSPRAVFVGMQNNRIGRIYYPSSYYEKVLTRKGDGKGGEVLLLQDGKCKYRLFLNKERVVIKWEYVSNPEDCVIEIDWFGHW
jgi:hypothetical protein